MITQEQQREGAKLLEILAQKAWESSSFKEQLIENPVFTIESVTGQKMQPDINVIVEDQTDVSKVYLNIPRRIEISELELTDEQLEMVAGGTDLIAGIALGVVLVAGGYLAGRGSK